MRSILILIVLMTLVVAPLRAEEGTGINIIELEITHDANRRPETVIIVLDVTGFEDTIVRYLVEIYDTEIGASRRDYHIDTRPSVNRLRIDLPTVLPEKTYWLRVTAFDEFDGEVSSASIDFEYGTPVTPQAQVTAQPSGAQSNIPAQPAADISPLIIVGGIAVFAGAVGVMYYYTRPKPTWTHVPAHQIKAAHDAGAPSAFVSYSRRDWEQYALPLAEKLRAAGVQVWIDQHTLESGDDWLDEINEALEASDCVVLCVSPEALESKYVKMEYRYFITENKPIFPVICREADMPAELRGIHFVPFARADEIIEKIKLIRQLTV